MNVDKATILKLDKPGPRYTSYPTAPEWSNEVRASAYLEKLQQFGLTQKTLSLYIHIPFCESLCYFCGCTMNVRKNEERYGNEYLDYLDREINLVRSAIGRPMTIRQLHWGGGTPSFLTEEQMQRLYRKIAESFQIDATGEIAIEVDPRRVTQSKIETLRGLGFNRISVGLQDFDEQVQSQVNRHQPFHMVKQFHDWCKAVHFESINFDLIYGLPGQTPETFARTIELVLKLRPDRIALYSFAYVPWLKKHQNKMDAKQLPSTDQKLEIFLNAREALLSNGYESIAMDHFALKSDELSKAFYAGKLYRNFMGYTVKPADEYIGMGTSAISFLEQTFFQNYKTIPEYYRFLNQGELPVERGKALTDDDVIRQWVITRLMCQFEINKLEFQKMFEHSFDEYFKGEESHICNCVSEGLLTASPKELRVTDLGKIFVRNVCMGFDWYLRQKNSHQRFSRTV